MSQANREIQSRFNMSQDVQWDHQLVLITDQALFQIILKIVASFQQKLLVMELYVELESNHVGFNSQLDLNSQAPVPVRSLKIEPNPVVVKYLNPLWDS